MQEIFQSLNAMARSYVDPKAPIKMKKMAADGKFPLPPQQMILVLYILSQDENTDIAQRATKNFHKQPSQVFEQYLSKTHKTPSYFLDFVARQFFHDSDKMEAILLHPNTSDDTVAWLALHLKDSLLELIAHNQQRQQRHLPILQNILQNEALSAGHRSRIIEFALRNNLDSGLTHAELQPYVAEGLLEELAIEEEPEEKELPAYMLEEEPEISLAEKAKGLTEEEAEQQEEKILSIEQQLVTYTVSEKIKAALKGGKSVRTILLRDPNRLVCTAVMKNPKLTESEVIAISSNRGVSDDVIREITRNREWMKMYTIKLNLVGNPKCPTPLAIRLLSHMRTGDLKNLAKNKGIPGVVSKAARKLFKERSH